jgi:hypothetical protein
VSQVAVITRVPARRRMNLGNSKSSWLMVVKVRDEDREEGGDDDRLYEKL